MLYIWNYHNVICQFYLNKTKEKINEKVYALNKQGNVTSQGKGQWSSKVCEKCCQHSFSNPGGACQSWAAPRPTGQAAAHALWEVLGGGTQVRIFLPKRRWVTATGGQEENPRSHTSAEAAFVQDWELGCYCSGSTEAHAVRQRDAARAAGRLQWAHSVLWGARTRLLSPRLALHKGDKSYTRTLLLAAEQTQTQTQALHSAPVS